MKITLALPSRGRPSGLLSVLTSMDALATGNHDITYALIVDDDDYVTLEQLEHWNKSGFLPDRTLIFQGARTATVNARVNDAIGVCPADLYSQIVDDGFPLSQHWDAIFYGAKDIPAFCWQEMNDPTNSTFLIISEKWRQAAGRFYPDGFPFWFADTWIAEVYKLAFDMPISIIQQLRMGGKRGTTLGMRDLAFWFRFFAFTRTERILEAETIAAAYGEYVDVRKDRAQALEQMEAGDAYQLTQVSRYEAVFKANLGEPSELYKACKARAEEVLALRVAA